MNEPVERDALIQLVRWQIESQFAIDRGRKEPKSYLPILAEAFSNATGQPRDVASWAVFTWHEALDQSGPKQRIHEPTSRLGASHVLAAFVLGIAVFAITGMSEFAMLKWKGRSLASLSVDRIASGPEKNSKTQNGWRTIILTAGTAGFFGFVAWGVYGTKSQLLIRSVITASIVAGMTNLLLTWLVIGGQTVMNITLSPIIDLTILVGLLAFVTWSAVTYVVNGRDSWNPKNDHESGWRIGDSNWSLR